MQLYFFSILWCYVLVSFCRCEELGLVQCCKEILSREATEAELLTKHTPEQIEILKATENVTDEEYLEKLSSKYDAIYIHPVSKI